jgi:tRNA1Val (adenine37-N6)-methyltransferase
MTNDFFNFKEFTIQQERSAFKVGTDGVLLGAAADLSGALSVLDVGTGTGLIAIICAQRSEVAISAIEPDHDSYLQAVENVKASRWSERISVIESDLQSFSEETGKRFDVIILNPPYFRDSLLNPDKIKSATRHSFSLPSDDILKGSDLLLSDTGSLQLILPYEEGTLFIAEAAGVGFYCNSIMKIKPYPEGKVIRMIMKFERVKKITYEKFLIIETGPRHSYTEEYKELTKDFYLKF